jgi:hypothetical protein
MWFLVFVAVVLVIVVVLNRWSRRRADRVDDYYERAYRDPPILGRWINGGRG